MAVLAIVLSAGARSKLGLALGILSLICVVPSLMLVGLGAYIKLKLADKIHLVEGYHGDILPYMLISVGLLAAIVNGLGGMICNMCSKPDTRAVFKSLMIPYLVIVAILCLCILAGGIMCFTEISHLHSSFHKGIILAMFKYRSNVFIKSKVDILQMEYRCCGNTRYTDWFQVPWINEDFLDVENLKVRKKMEGKADKRTRRDAYMNDDVPFSCCDPSSRRPCIHHDVHDNDKHYNYDFRMKTTLHKHGCKKELMAFFGDQVLTNGGAITLGVFGFQLIILILSRYLQSSVHNAMAQGDTTAPAPGWLIGDSGVKSPTEDDVHVKLVPGDRDGLEETEEEEETEEVEITEELVEYEEDEEPIYENIPFDITIGLGHENVKN